MKPVKDRYERYNLQTGISEQQQGTYRQTGNGCDHAVSVRFELGVVFFVQHEYQQEEPGYKTGEQKQTYIRRIEITVCVLRVEIREEESGDFKPHFIQKGIICLG